MVQTGSEEISVPGLPPAMAVSAFSLRPLTVQRLDETETRSLDKFKGQRVHGVAAIGNPERFFNTLATAGMDVIRHPYPDHATLGVTDLSFDDGLDVIMTEKDAVKCHDLALGNLWYVRVEATVHASSGVSLIEGVEKTITAHD
jgi:tetraacyldisaccharide 4'-kinase